jgi:hypothetical protein
MTPWPQGGVSSVDPRERFLTRLCLREGCAIARTTAPFCTFPDVRLGRQDAERLTHIATGCTRQYRRPPAGRPSAKERSRSAVITCVEGEDDEGTG